MHNKFIGGCGCARVVRCTEHLVADGCSLQVLSKSSRFLSGSLLLIKHSIASSLSAAEPACVNFFVASVHCPCCLHNFASRRSTRARSSAFSSFDPSSSKYPLKVCNSHKHPYPALVSTCRTPSIRVYRSPAHGLPPCPAQHTVGIDRARSKWRQLAVSAPDVGLLRAQATRRPSFNVRRNTSAK